MARVNDVCDALVADGLALWNASIAPAVVAAPDEIARTYLTPADLGKLTGRKVWITPAGFADEQASRKENLGEYTIAVVVAERYDGDAERPPDDWLDERVDFVEMLYDRFGSFGNERASGWLVVDGRRLWTERSAVGEVYAFDCLDKFHCFWAELEFEFRETRG